MRRPHASSRRCGPATTIDQKPYRLVGLADGSTEVYEVLDDGSPRLALAVPGSVYVLARID